MVLFGPGGNSVSFYNDGYKSTLDAPKWLFEKGLEAYEYECGQGVRVSTDTAKKFGDEARKYGITLSVHAPYFISLASEEESKRENSIKKFSSSPPDWTFQSRLVRFLRKNL